MALLEVKNLRIGIQHGHEYFSPVDGISFTINAGEIVGLAGESGCGKTLTSLSLLRLLPQAACISGGAIYYHTISGETVDLCSLDEECLRRIRGKEISMIFQEPRQSLNPLMRIGAQTAETLELHGTPKTTAHEAALELLNKLRFPQPEKILRARPYQLSGGMCQRVMIAIAAICRPRLLIADEPLTALDTENQNHILSLLKQINREFGTAVLFISHDLPLAKNFCSRFLIMNAGKIVEEGPSQTLFTAPVHHYTRELVEAMPSRKNRSRPLTQRFPPIIIVRNLSSAYISRNFGLFGKKEIKPVLKNVNLEIGAGEIFGLTGESGCGKTTLARCILGLIDYEGEILIGGRERDSTFQAAGQMVFQDPAASLNPVKKIGWLMEEPLIIRRIGAAEERSRKVNEMLIRVGLDPSYKTRRASELSGGQKQRVCIGRALMLNSKILIADEAISALDAVTGAQILKLFLELRESLGLTVIFISHNISAAEYLCDRITVMKDGSIS
ncbi:MAG: ABC transporter ATP-binding protein [Treponema sp.]|nr:ABC transporter ATP-binding protein [Treponema sp.]